jgi:hypothetical protein
MPIEFACECGKRFSVRDEFAGKRTKCPACGAGLVVPELPKPETETDEDAAFRLLEETPEPEFNPQRYNDTPPTRSNPADAAPAPGAQPMKASRIAKLNKPSKEQRKQEREARKPRPYDPDRPRKILYMIGGGLMMICGGALCFYAFDGGAIRGGVFGVLMVFSGIGTFFQGVSGNFDDE